MFALSTHSLRRVVITAIVLGAAIVGIRQPAAAVNATFYLTRGRTTITAYCPAHVHFGGAITGQPGVSVTYLFARFVNGQPIDSAPITATIPPSGTLPVPMLLLVDSAHDGFQSYGIFFTSPVDSQVSGNHKTYFTINCTPIPIAYYPVRPQNLRSTTDPGTCLEHVGTDLLGLTALLCAAAIRDNGLMLIWDTNNSPDPDEYRIYRVDGGRHDLIDKTTKGGGAFAATGHGLAKPADGYVGKCYAVTAYKGLESDASNTFCVGNDVRLGTTETTLNAIDSAFRYKQHTFYTGTGFGGFGTHCDGPCVGFVHFAEQNLIRDDQHAAAFRGYYLFDPNAIRNLKVFAATLRLPVTGGNTQCLAEIGPAEHWQGVDQFVGGEFGGLVGERASNGIVSIDVTDIVRAWALGAPNNGFVLRGSNEDTGAFDNNQCTVDFGTNATMTIEHF